MVEVEEDYNIFFFFVDLLIKIYYNLYSKKCDNMKKSIKIVLISITSIFGLLGIYIILIVKGILPNPFLDTKDLVCTRGTIFDAETRTEKTIKFKWNGHIKEIESKETLIFFEEEQAVDVFSSLKKSIGEDWEEYMSIEESTVVINSKDPISIDEEKMSKKQIKDKYKENGYEC